MTARDSFRKPFPPAWNSRLVSRASVSLSSRVYEAHVCVYVCCYVTRTARTAAQPASVFFTCGGATSCFQPPYTHIQLIMEMLRVSKLLTRLLNVTQKLVGLQEMETTTTHHHRHCVSQLSLWPVQVTHSATTRREHSGDSPTLTAVRYYLFIFYHIKPRVVLRRRSLPHIKRE